MLRVRRAAASIAFEHFVLLGCGFALLGCSDDPSSTGPDPDPGPGLVELNPALCAPNQNGFTLESHPFFPMEPGLQWFYEGEEDGEFVELQITILDETREIDGITTRVIEEREWIDEELVEVSWNYFAHAPDGSICYYGEDVDIFEDGDIVHDGAWCADQPGNAAGIFMPADPEPGMTYPNEIAPGVAEDEATIVEGGPVDTPFGPFVETLHVEEFNPLDGDRGLKVFGLGTGLVVDGPVELIEFVQDAADGGQPIPSDPTCGS